MAAQKKTDKERPEGRGMLAFLQKRSKIGRFVGKARRSKKK